MTRQLNEQKFCGWCGVEVNYRSEWMSECPGCGYKNYISPKPCSNLIITKNGALLMVKRAIDPGKNKYDFTGGFMDMTDASMEDTTYREALEEIGLRKGDISTPIYDSSDVQKYNWMDTELLCACFFFLAELLVEPSSLKINLEENSSFMWVTKENYKSVDIGWEVDRKFVEKYFNNKEDN